MCLNQTGVHGDVFQVGILTLNHSFSVDKVLEYSDSGNQTGCIIVGKVLNSDLKPCMVVLNRNKTRCIVGPNRIYYDALSS